MEEAVALGHKLIYSFPPPQTTVLHAVNIYKNIPDTRYITAPPDPPGFHTCRASPTHLTSPQHLSHLASTPAPRHPHTLPCLHNTYLGRVIAFEAGHDLNLDVDDSLVTICLRVAPDAVLGVPSAAFSSPPVAVLAVASLPVAVLKPRDHADRSKNSLHNAKC